MLILLTKHTGLLVTNVGFRAGTECGIIKRTGEDFRTVMKQELDACLSDTYIVKPDLEKRVLVTCITETVLF